jgi:hypothetical protein
LQIEFRENALAQVADLAQACLVPFAPRSSDGTATADSPRSGPPLSDRKHAAALVAEWLLNKQTATRSAWENVR